MRIWENIKLAFRAIRANLLRTILTVIIIAFGITALIGILTATDGITASINENFAGMGANTFSITEKNERGGFGGIANRLSENITYREAMAFRDRYAFSERVSVSTLGTFTATVKRGSEKTNPNVFVYGVDDDYLSTSGLKLEMGRNISSNEVRSGNNVIMLGQDVYKRLFPGGQDPLDKYVFIGNIRYVVIGVLESKGSGMMGAGDNQVLASINNVRSRFPNPNGRYVISVSVDNQEQMEQATGEAIGLFRNIRRLDTKDENDFQIEKSDSLANEMVANLQMVALLAGIIGFITLIGAAVALMNILLVSVTERTREIGITKAIGAKKSHIRMQFFTEAIVISQIGGLIGVLLGLVIGNLVSIALGSVFIIPWFWIAVGLGLCFTVAIIAGLYPAIKASNLDPIEALRYE